MPKPEFPHGYFDGGEEGPRQLSWLSKFIEMYSEPTHWEISFWLGPQWIHVVCEEHETIKDGIDRVFGNAADGDRWREPKDYGAGAETCPECKGQKGFLVTTWIAIRDYLPGEITECLPSFRYEVCDYCHGTGRVAVKEE